MGVSRTLGETGSGRHRARRRRQLPLPPRGGSVDPGDRDDAGAAGSRARRPRGVPREERSQALRSPFASAARSDLGTDAPRLWEYEVVAVLETMPATSEPRGRRTRPRRETWPGPRVHIGHDGTAKGGHALPRKRDVERRPDARRVRRSRAPTSALAAAPLTHTGPGRDRAPDPVRGWHDGGAGGG